MTEPTTPYITSHRCEKCGLPYDLCTCDEVEKEERRQSKTYCYWCLMHDGKRVVIDKVYWRDITHVEPFTIFHGNVPFHKECLIKQLKYEISLEERDFNRKKEALLKEIEEVKRQ